MFDWIIRKIIGTKNQRTIKKIWPTVQQINALEEKLQSLPEETLRERTAAWQERFKAFHAPHFLAGVALRVANDEQVDDSLSSVAEKFKRLAPHFPTLDQNLVDEASWRNESLDAKKERIKKARAAYDDILPQFAKIESQILDEIMPEAIAVVKNAARRMCGR